MSDYKAVERGSRVFHMSNREFCFVFFKFIFDRGNEGFETDKANTVI